MLDLLVVTSKIRHMGPSSALERDSSPKGSNDERSRQFAPRSIFHLGSSPTNYSSPRNYSAGESTAAPDDLCHGGCSVDCRQFGAVGLCGEWQWVRGLHRGVDTISTEFDSGKPACSHNAQWRWRLNCDALHIEPLGENEFAVFNEDYWDSTVLNAIDFCLLRLLISSTQSVNEEQLVHETSQQLTIPLDEALLRYCRLALEQMAFIGLIGVDQNEVDVVF